MKLMICVVDDFYVDEIESRTKRLGYRMTKLSSSGSFLRKGSTTFLFGIKENEVEVLTESLKSICLAYEKKKGKKQEQAHRFISFLVDADNASALAAL